jgi:predicted membrane-bound mannosyltransferase
MAGKIIADQIEHSTAGSLDTSYVVNGSAKAWVTFNTTQVVQDSLNTSSITDNSAGDQTGNWSNNFTGNTYAALYDANGTANNNALGGNGPSPVVVNRTSSSSRVQMYNDGSYEDSLWNSLIAIGDLA